MKMRSKEHDREDPDGIMISGNLAVRKPTLELAPKFALEFINSWIVSYPLNYSMPATALG